MKCQKGFSGFRRKSGRKHTLINKEEAIKKRNKLSKELFNEGFSGDFHGDYEEPILIVGLNPKVTYKDEFKKPKDKKKLKKCFADWVRRCRGILRCPELATSGYFDNIIRNLNLEYGELDDYFAHVDLYKKELNKIKEENNKHLDIFLEQLKYLNPKLILATGNESINFFCNKENGRVRLKVKKKMRKELFENKKMENWHGIKGTWKSKDGIKYKIIFCYHFSRFNNKHWDKVENTTKNKLIKQYIRKIFKKHLRKKLKRLNDVKK